MSLITRSLVLLEDRAERPVWNHDQVIRQNIIAHNRDARVWGWFDVKDNRHWPAKKGRSSPEASSGPKSAPDMPVATTARTDPGPAGALTLESLRLHFHRNVYFAGPGQGWFAWGPTWARHASYPSLREFQENLNLDTEGRCVAPDFANLSGCDLRLEAEAMRELGGCYPQGAVPGVVLGIQ